MDVAAVDATRKLGHLVLCLQLSSKGFVEAQRGVFNRLCIQEIHVVKKWMVVGVPNLHGPIHPDDEEEVAPAMISHASPPRNSPLTVWIGYLLQNLTSYLLIIVHNYINILLSLLLHHCLLLIYKM